MAFNIPAVLVKQFNLFHHNTGTYSEFRVIPRLEVLTNPNTWVLAFGLSSFDVNDNYALVSFYPAARRAHLFGLFHTEEEALTAATTLEMVRNSQ